MSQTFSDSEHPTIIPLTPTFDSSCCSSSPSSLTTASTNSTTSPSPTSAVGIPGVLMPGNDKAIWNGQAFVPGPPIMFDPGLVHTLPKVWQEKIKQRIKEGHPRPYVTFEYRLVPALMPWEAKGMGEV